MKFNELTPQLVGIIFSVYQENPSAEADRILAEKFEVSERTIREWARNLGLTGKKKIATPVPQLDPNRLPLMYEEGKSRVLVIGDLHAPFDLDKYLKHCKKMYKQFNCDTVVFIGDIIDNHYSSYHNTDPDGLGGGQELEYAIQRIQKYYKAFPKAYVCVGNHDRMAARKAFSGGLPKQWIKSYAEVLGTPNWEFVTEVDIDGVLYIHGEGGTAKTKMKAEMMPVVQGHLHTQAYIEWLFSKTGRIFGMQVGTGIDFAEYAFAYAKAGKKPAVSLGIVLNGLYPFLIPMDL
jgi:predicted phosphodiesterase